jgi:hypothetical protein
MPVVTIPLKGTISGLVGLAPFQYAPSNPSLGLPKFENQSSGIPGDVGAGFWGLRSIYASISPWKGNGNYGDQIEQFAGSQITSGGIFEYDLSLANPAEYNPVLSSGAGYTAQNRGVGSAFNRFVTTNQASGATGPLARYAFNFPALNFENIKKPLSLFLRQLWIAPYSVVGPGFVSAFQPGYLSIDDASRQEIAMQFTVDGIIPPDGGLPSMLAGMFAKSSAPIAGSSVNVYGAYQPQLIVKRNVLNCALPVGFGISGIYSACVNPGNGNFIMNVQNTTQGNPPYNYIAGVGNGLYHGNVFYEPQIHTPPIGGAYTGNVIISSLVLSDATDNAAISSPTSGAPNYTAIMTPRGYFLLFLSGYPYFFYIAPDFSGYWRIILQGTTPDAQAAVSNGGASSTGFGVDLNGNLWFGGAAAFVPLLYSTFGLSFDLNFNPLPDVLSNGIGCRMMGGIAQAVWEG